MVVGNLQISFLKAAVWFCLVLSARGRAKRGDNVAYLSPDGVVRFDLGFWSGVAVVLTVHSHFDFFAYSELIVGRRSVLNEWGPV